MYVTHLVEKAMSAGEVAVRNAEKLDALCDALDLDRVEYTTRRGRGGWHVRIVLAGEEAPR